MVDFFVAHEVVDVDDEGVDGEKLDCVVLSTGVCVDIEDWLDDSIGG